MIAVLIGGFVNPVNRFGKSQRNTIFVRRRP